MQARMSQVRRNGAKPVLIIGLDAATFEIIDPMITERRLPHLERLIREGVSAVLRSTIPPLSPNAWSSFATGKNAGKHGIYSFTRLKPNSYDVQYVNGGMRAGTTLWRLLSGEGFRVGVVNVPMTYPPEPVNGFLISGLDAPSINCEFTHPPQLRDEIRQQVGQYTIELSLLGTIDAERSESVVQQILRAEERRIEATRYLMRRYPCDFLVVVLTAIDRVQHFYWHAMEPRHHRYNEPGAEVLRTVIPDTYEKMDQLIGELLADLPSDATVLVVSDHGAGPFDNSLPYLNLNDWLYDLGLLHLRGGKSSLGYEFLRGIRATARRILAPSIKSELKRRFGGVQGKVQSYLYFSLIDWARTKAFASHDEFLARGIRINLRGREPCGIVAPGAEYEQLRSTLSEALRDLRHPRTGLPVVTQVHCREDVYSGPHLGEAPDLVVEWAEEAFFSGGESVPEHKQKFKLSYLQRSGEHRRSGILVAKGPHFKRGVRISPIDIVDVTPTVLYMMGCPVPTDMDGRVLTEVFDPAFVSDRAVVYAEPVEEADRTDLPYSDSDAQMIAERLRGLGYID